MSIQTEQKINSPHWEAFLRALADRIAEPTPSQPTVRCWSLTSLATMVQEFKQSNTHSTFPDAPEVLRHLINIGWAYPIDVELPKATTLPSKNLFLLDIGAAHGAIVDPLELLQAYKPNGVICYFSALSYHSLTTQFATHHHIATLKKPSPLSKKDSSKTTVDKTKASVVSNRRFTLGEHVFTYQGIPFYLIKRLSSLLFGVQTRILGPRTNIRITTLEQTLLDTLHKPKYCGGVPVIFEAWKEGITRLDEDLLKDYLSKMDSPLFLRRVGAMFDLLNYKPASDLATTLEKGMEHIAQNVTASAVPILPGLEFSVLNPKWKVLTP